MKILVISEGSYPETLGGSQTVVYDTSRLLAERGHEVVVMSSSRQTSFKGFLTYLSRNLSLQRVSYREGNRLLGILSFALNFCRDFKRLIKENSFDVMIAHHVISGALAMLCVKNKIPLVYFFHSPWYREYEIRKSYKRKEGLSWNEKGIAYVLKIIQGFLISHAKEVWVQSDYMKEEVQKLVLSYPSERILKLTSGIDIQKFVPAKDRQALRRQMEISEKTFLMFTVRRLVPRMGIDALIEAMPAVLTARPNAQLWIAGTGPLENQLKEKVHALKLQSSVRLLGEVRNPAFIQTYQAADLFVMPSTELEGLGLVILESMACGTPVLGTPVGGIKEILSQFEEHLMTKGTFSKDLVKGILDWASHEKVGSLRIKARKFIEEQFNWKKTIDRMESRLTVLANKALCV